MVVIDRDRCCGCGKCVSLVITLPCLGEKGMYEFYQDPLPQDTEYVDNIMKECWAQCIFYHKD